jgi:hypothetical protein
MKKFAGFTPQQQYTLLSKQGYTGPADEASMAKFLAASPSAASKMGEYAQIAQQRLAGQPMPTQAMAAGGDIFSTLWTPEWEAKILAAANADAGTSTDDQVPDSTSEPMEASITDELMEASVTDPSSLVTEPEVVDIKETKGTTIKENAFDLDKVKNVSPVKATIDQVKAPKKVGVKTVDAITLDGDIPQADAVVGEVSDESLVDAEQGELSDTSIAEGAKFDEEFLDEVTAGERQVTSDELVTAAGQDVEAIKAEIAQSEGLADVVAEQGVVRPEELPDAATIAESDMAQAEAITAEGLAPDAIAVAARLEKFSVDEGTLAKAIQGEVNALDTVQGQLSDLMKSFDDGKTPAWAAGAMRAANAAMASRGLGGSSMAASAILQAAMESALPIAEQDAKTFASMNLANLDNTQKVALANAAAQQGLAIENLRNEQAAALQNSANAFSLQTTNLTNMQTTMIANAQIKAALQEKNLTNQQQSNIAVAARYAEMANLNLNNRQQATLQNNLNAVNIELANLNNRQQAYLANAQIEAALQGKQIDKQQEAAIANAARFADAADISFTAEQQAKLHNSQLLATIGTAELDARQAAILQNAANSASMDVANLNNRQAAAVANAKAFLDMDVANLDNEQKTVIFNTESKIQSLLSDQSAENAARQFNATSENQNNQFFTNLAETAKRFNTEQKNALRQFNTGEQNAASRFNAELQQQRNKFNADNSLIIAQANAVWRQNISTLNTSAQNEANITSAKIASGFTQTTIDNIWQRERDIMNSALTTAEGDADRAVSLMVADKDFDAVKFVQSAKDNAAKSQLITERISKIFKWDDD